MDTTTKRNVVTAAVLLCAAALTGCSVQARADGRGDAAVSVPIWQQIQDYRRDNPPRPIHPHVQVLLRQLMEADRGGTAPPTAIEKRTASLRQLMEADRGGTAPPTGIEKRTASLRQLMEAGR